MFFHIFKNGELVDVLTLPKPNKFDIGSTIQELLDKNGEDTQIVIATSNKSDILPCQRK